MSLVVVSSSSPVGEVTLGSGAPRRTGGACTIQAPLDRFDLIGPDVVWSNLGMPPSCPHDAIGITEPAAVRGHDEHVA